MNPDKARELAAKADRLSSDEAFQSVMSEIRENQLQVFLKGDSSQEEIMEAHRVIHALSQIDGHIRRMKSDAAIINRKENQDRG